ncbi:MAG: hypothetical protein QM497_01785 [Sulfurimonas sp.]
MAESLEEEIIIIEDGDAASVEGDEETQEQSGDDEAGKKKKIIILGGIAILLVLIIVIILLLVIQSNKTQVVNSFDLIDDKLQEKRVEKIVPSKLENMIVKANYLYSSGSKKEALTLYEKIAQYSEVISLYNLGVAQLKDEQYKLSQQTFQKAIKNNEKICVSAINAAVCSLHLKEQENFKYYIDLAYAYLPNELSSPLYSYYYALINYYNQNYLEALSALKNSSSNEYPFIHKNLKAKVDALFGNDYDAIEAMEANAQDKDEFSIALLYARIGDFTLATSHFKEAILKNIEPVKAQLALGLVYLKAGRITKATKEIKNVSDMFAEQIYKPYPIKVTLKSSLFHPKKAQAVYRNKLRHSELLNFQKIFYFSPYKIFNANQTISYIRKGNANIYIDNVKSAKEYLKTGASSSSVNYGIAQAIKKALSFKIREANQELQKLIKVQPKHSILQYNLALTYAQMGDMLNANKHFILSYHLDAKNYLSGVYAVMTSKLINKENSKLESILKDSISEEEDSEDKTLFITLLDISDNNYISAIEWLDNDYKEKPLYIALNIIISLHLKKIQLAKDEVTKLTLLLPHDILPHMMYIDACFSNTNDSEYAAEVLNYLKVQKLNFDDLYYGPYISRYLYIQQNLITGKLYYLQKQLEAKLETTTQNRQEIISALAMVYLFDKNFEKSYTLYNSLIDELKVRDPFTLFLGAVASTAADHHGNAIALLELANLKNADLAESRFALGLLYLETKNNEAATIQFAHINKESFISKYFDFDIDVDALLFKKQHTKDSLEVIKERR